MDKSEALRLYMVAKDRGHYGAPDAISRLNAELQAEQAEHVAKAKKPPKGTAKGNKPTKGKGARK